MFKGDRGWCHSLYQQFSTHSPSTWSRDIIDLNYTGGIELNSFTELSKYLETGYVQIKMRSVNTSGAKPHICRLTLLSVFDLRCRGKVGNLKAYKQI